MSFQRKIPAKKCIVSIGGIEAMIYLDPKGKSSGHRPPGNAGNDAFTLLEVIIAMVLMSAVVLAAGMALRLAVEANERIQSEGDSRQVFAILPNILEKQLACVRTNLSAPQTANQTGKRVAHQQQVDRGLGSSRMDNKLLFCGTETEVSFLTAFSRQGSLYQGLSWVHYRYDPSLRTLMVYEQILTRMDDVNLDGNRLSRKGVVQRDPDLVGRIENISSFRLSYAEEIDTEWINASAWLSSWECDSGLSDIDLGVPAQVALFLEVGLGKGRQNGLWIFPVGSGSTTQ